MNCIWINSYTNTVADLVLLLKRMEVKENRTIHHCPVACKTDNDTVIQHLGEHNHSAPAEAAIAMKGAINTTKKRAREESTPLQQILKQNMKVSFKTEV